MCHPVNLSSVQGAFEEPAGQEVAVCAGGQQQFVLFLLLVGLLIGGGETQEEEKEEKGRVHFKACSLL